MDPLVLQVPTVGITGSCGKTMTKEMVAAVLATRFNTFKSKENKNQIAHTRKHRDMIKPSHEAVVLEFGMGRRKGRKHCRIIQPNIGIITNIGIAHIGKLGNSVKHIARNKSSLIKHMDQNGTLLINSDDENSQFLKKDKFKGEIVTVGIKNKADFEAENITYEKNGMSFTTRINNKLEKFSIPVFGYHNVINALFAIAVARQLNLSPSEINAGFKALRIPKGRLNIITLKNKIKLIDDSYNANPQSVKAAIDVLTEIGKKKNLIVVLGSMTELGEFTTKAHEDIGAYLSLSNVNCIFTYGEDAAFIKRSAIKNGFPTKHIFHFNTRAKLHEALEEFIKSHTIILVKGSRMMQMESTVNYLCENYG